MTLQVKHISNNKMYPNHWYLNTLKIVLIIYNFWNVFVIQVAHICSNATKQSTCEWILIISLCSVLPYIRPQTDIKCFMLALPGNTAHWSHYQVASNWIISLRHSLHMHSLIIPYISLLGATCSSFYAQCNVRYKILSDTTGPVQDTCILLSKDRTKSFS